MSLYKTSSLRQMATFQAVARLGSVSLAAEELHLSQSALSIQIASLESSIGTPLLTRTGRGVRPTEAGLLLLSYADRLLTLWHEASDEMTTFLGSFSGTLRIGAVSTAEYWLPRLLVDFVNHNPRVKIKLQVANRGEIVRSLAAQEVDIAVMGHPPDELKVTAFAFAKNPMAFMAAPYHPLANDPALSMAKLAESNLLVRERGSGTRTTVERLFREEGLRLRIGSELSSTESIKQMCAAGFGPAYLSLHTCILETRAGQLKVLPLAGNPVERQWYVVRIPLKQLPQVTTAFEEFLRLHGQEGIDRLVAGGDETLPEPAAAEALTAGGR
ncbi:MAG: LysR family transcriptional regulator [Chitinophagaceae bacterium]|nr:LysR family transcriptional regulator [Rubrivivax sp.]